MDNRPIYFPSFGAGAFGNLLIADFKLHEDLSSRFYSTEFPKEFRHPYFLVSAGHFYKKLQTKEKFGFEDDVLKFGDSGGYQIATGVLDWEDVKKRETNRKLILDWLEYNSNIAMNLDVPPRGKYDGQFDVALNYTLENMKYFSDNRNGKCLFLNIIQGRNYDQYEYWYSKVSQFNFEGWSIGGAIGNLYNMLSALTILLKNKEHLKKNNKYIHLLGASRMIDFATICQVQKSFNEIGSDVVMTCDSSTPAIANKFGDFYAGYDLKNMRYLLYNIPKIREDFDKWNFGNDLLPLCTPFDNILRKEIKVSEMVKFDKPANAAFTLHNLFVFLDTKRAVEDYILGFDVFMKAKFSKDSIKLLAIIDEMVKTDAEKVFNKHRPFLLDYSRKIEADEKKADLMNTGFFN